MDNLLNLINQFFNSWPFVKIIWDYFWLILSLSALMAFAGLDFVSAICRIRGILDGRILYNKLGRQLALLAMGLGWLLLIVSRVWLYFDHPSPAANTAEYYIVEISWILLSIAVLLSSVYFLLWNVLKNLPVLLTTIGMISAVQCCFSALAVLASARMLVNPHALSALEINEIFSLSWNSSLWSVCACTFPLFCAMPAAWAATWLPTRKKKDNFGRDYYNFAIIFCSKWARNSWGILWLVLLFFDLLYIWQSRSSMNFGEQIIILHALRLLLWFIPIILWQLASRSALALRHKGGIFLAFVIASCFMLTYFQKLTQI